MSDERKPGLGFGADRVVSVVAPLVATELHRPHELDWFDIEVIDGEDAVVISLSEVDTVSGIIPVTRMSMPIPMSMLADLVRQRPLTPAEREDLEAENGEQEG